MGADKEVYFHVGLAKTGTTWLQYKVFPKFRNICYIQRTKYARSFDIIRKTSCERYLVSNETDMLFFREMDRIAGTFPGAGIIMVLRSNESWWASQYRRWVKNGYPGTFESFVDLDNDLGLFKLEQARFYPYIEKLTQKFHKRPLVLLYDELTSDPQRFVRKIACYVGAEYDPDKIPVRKFHKSYNTKQLLLRRKFNEKFRWQMPLSKNLHIAFLQKLFFVFPVRYGLLYLAKVWPRNCVPQEELIPQDYLERLREFYRDDWEKCVAYAEQVKEEG